MPYRLYYRPRQNTIPIISGIAYDTRVSQEPVEVTPKGGLPTADHLRCFVCNNLRFADVNGGPGETISNISAWGTNANIINHSSELVATTNISDVSAGAFHLLALNEDGTVRGWGSNSNGQLEFLNHNLTNVKKVSAGGYHSLFLFNDGTISGCGNNYGQHNLRSAYTSVKDVSAGGFHSLVLFNNGTVTGWGNSSANQAQNVPEGLTQVDQISAGSYHSLAIIKNPSNSVTQLTGWGGGYNSIYRNAAELLSGEIREGQFAGLKKVSAGTYHSLAIYEKFVQRAPNSTAYDKLSFVTGWGNNSPAQVDSSTPNIHLADGGNNLVNVKDISAAAYHNLVHFNNGIVTGWGNSTALINFNDTFYDKISAGYDYSVGVKTSTPPFKLENLISAWPFNDLYFKGCDVVLEPCFYQTPLSFKIKKPIK
jgi:alpha-tubulin suppressor-like RCC1 family protein